MFKRSFKKFNKWLLRKFHKHDFQTFSDGTKRKCIKCNQEEWLFENRYSDIGQPKYHWKEV